MIIKYTHTYSIYIYLFVLINFQPTRYTLFILAVQCTKLFTLLEHSNVNKSKCFNTLYTL